MTHTGHRPSDLDPVRQEAVAWVQRLLAGRVTGEDAERLRLWCAISPAHAAAFAEARRVWTDLGRVGGDARFRSELAEELAAARRRIVTRRAVFMGGVAAAGLGAVAVTRPPLGLWPSLSELAADYRTGTGEQRQIALADAVVRMNTRTSLVVRPADAEGDHVELLAGEAAFATDTASRALIVRAGDGETAGLRARFDVRRRHSPGAAVDVTCHAGEVHTRRGSDRVVIRAGERLRYDAVGLGRVEAVQLEVVAAWQQGIVVFRATPLSEVVDEINRYRPGRIVLVDAELGRKPVNGRFRIDQMDEILTRLALAFDARVRRLPGGIVLLG